MIPAADSLHPPILIVDDSDDDVELFLLGLEEANLVNPVHRCRDGVEALDYLHRRGAYAELSAPLPLFVLMDIKMPRMDGLDLLARMRAVPAMATLPVIVMTSSNRSADVAAAYARHANSFVVKPVDFLQLKEAARTVGVYWGRFNQRWSVFQPESGSPPTGT